MKSSLKKGLIFSGSSFLLSSATVFFMPLASFELETWQKSLAYILAIVFWIGLIAGLIVLLSAGRYRKRDSEFRSRGGVTLFRFFSNKPAIISDLLFFAGLIITALSLFIHTLPPLLTTAGIFLLVFFAEMHGIFNGKNYEYLSNPRLCPAEKSNTVKPRNNMESLEKGGALYEAQEDSI